RPDARARSRPQRRRSAVAVGAGRNGGRRRRGAPRTVRRRRRAGAVLTRSADARRGVLRADRSWYGRGEGRSMSTNAAVAGRDDRRILNALRDAPRASSPGAISATITLGWRALLKIKHVPFQLFDVTVFPLMM